MSNTVGAYFFVNEDNILEPLGVIVAGDSRLELLPSTRDNTEEIPGRDGEYDFGSEFKARLLQLHCVVDGDLSATGKSNLQRILAKHLDPTKGVKSLVFADDIEKMYMVKYSGKIDITNHARWFEFVIPFKMSDPFIIGTTEKKLTGSGMLVNNGTKEVGLIIELKGPLVNPQISIGPSIIFYDGEIAAGHSLFIDTEKRTVKMGQANAVDRYNNVFPLLYPGESPANASSNVSFKWRDKWI